MTDLLRVQDIHTYYGLSHVLHGVSIEVHQGEVVCLLGRNGAGKTTTIRSVMGLTPPARGRVLVFDQPVQDLPPYKIFRMGVRWIPQGRRIFPMLSVEENIRLALVQSRTDNEAAEIDRVFDMFPVLREKRKDRAGTLSGGQLQMAAIARALIGDPKLILMDEPTEGLAPLIIQGIAQVILSIKAGGTTVLLAEQNLPMALAVADRHYIIDQGQIRFQGTGRELEDNEEIKTAYLGVARETD
ncbi:MAG: ABC transporter ATP-binding protein [Proteobacteria bacterium]|nr:ABC transporter ATP-binding protein [Pseudomonadota bacterium]